MKSFIVIRAVVALFGVGTTLGVSVMVSNVGGGSDVRVVEWAGPNYAQDVRGFTPVAPSLLLDLAAPVARSLRPVRAVTRRAPVTTPVAPGVAASPEPVADPDPAPPPPAPDPAPDLSLVMTADKDTVHPNDIVTYTIRVSNAGPGAARSVVIESHVPDGTSLAGWECDGTSHSGKGRESFVCGPVDGQSSHTALFGIATLPASSEVVFRFSVRVSPGLRHNTAITNHAHVYAKNADLVDSEQVTVIV